LALGARWLTPDWGQMPFALRKVSKSEQTPFVLAISIPNTVGAMESVKHDPPLGSAGSRIVRKGDCFRPMPNAQPNFSGDYSPWLNQWVVLKVATGKSQTELVCTVIAESDVALRIRVAECEVDIYKEMILGLTQAWPAQTPGYLDLEPQEETYLLSPA
jgi:hypothetical protein